MIVSKAVHMAEMMSIPVLGLIENYSWYQCPDCGARHAIFGESRLEEVARELGLPILARLPIDPALGRRLRRRKGGGGGAQLPGGSGRPAGPLTPVLHAHRGRQPDRCRPCFCSLRGRPGVTFPPACVTLYRRRGGESMLVYLAMIPTEEGRNKFALLYWEYRDLMFYLALRILGSQQDAEDAVQEALLRITEIIEKIHDPVCPETKALSV